MSKQRKEAMNSNITVMWSMCTPKPKLISLVTTPEVHMLEVNHVQSERLSTPP